MNTALVTCTNRTPITAGTGCLLRKQPNNAFDSEAIAVEVGNFPVGYVSATYKTRLPGTISGGRIYDRFADTISGKFVSDKIITIDFP